MMKVFLRTKIFYTDGLTEARSPTLEFIGVRRVRALIESLGHGTGEEMVKGLFKAAAYHMGTEPAHDDIAVVVVELPRREARAQAS